MLKILRSEIAWVIWVAQWPKLHVYHLNFIRKSSEALKCVFNLRKLWKATLKLHLHTEPPKEIKTTKCKRWFSLLKIALHILILVLPLRVRYFGHIVIQLKWKVSALSFRRGQLLAAKFYKVFNLVHKYLIRIGWYTSWSKVRNQRRNLGNNLRIVWKLRKTKAKWPTLLF